MTEGSTPYESFEKNVLRKVDAVVGVKRNHELAVEVLRAAENLPFGVGLKALTLIATGHQEISPNEKLQVEMGKSVTFNGYPVRFPVPVMVGAGFAESSAVVSAMSAVGFGGVEAGTYTLNPVKQQPGQGVYISKDTNIVVHNIEGVNPGAYKAKEQLQRYTETGIPIGASIGVEGKESQLLIPQTLAKTAAILDPVASYFTINTGTLPHVDNSLFPSDALLTDTVRAMRERVGKPLFIKLEPGMSDEDLERAIKLSMDLRLGVIATNGTKDTTVVDRSQKARLWGQEYRVSGDLYHLYTEALYTIGRLYQGSGGELFIMGAGGVSSAQRAIKMYEEGAWITQVKSGIRTKGLGLANEITNGLDAFLTERGMDNMSQLVGSKFRNAA